VNETSKKIKTVLKNLPDKPGVYKMIDSGGRVIYIGKAKNLKKRVSSYFQKTKTLSPRTQKLIENVEDISYTVVGSELEALIFELNLIKELRPKYNILLKDDKNFVYIKITKEDFPRIQIVRKIDDRKATYFGPKTSKAKVEKTFQMLKKVFHFRHCNLDIEELNEKNTAKNAKNNTSTGVIKSVKVTHETIKYPCLDYYIKRCSAPCIANISKDEYNEAIENIKRFFEGHHEEIIKNIKKQMMELATNKEFEKAARLRDTLQSIESILERQSISDPNQEDKDIFNYVIDSGKAFFNLFQIREGKLINQENFAVQAASVTDEDEDAKAELLSSFLEQYYEKTTNIPKEILIPHEFQERDELEDYLSEEKGKKVKILIPQKGQKNKLLELSHKNAKIFADRNRASWREEGDDKKNILKDLQALLNLPKEPKRIECYDISHLSGTDTVASMVVFENGVPKNSDYRRFKIRTVGKALNDIDDFKSIAEVISRRASYIGEIKDEFLIRKGKKTDENQLGKEFKNYYIVATKEKSKEKICGQLMSKKYGQYERISRFEIDPQYRGARLGQRLLKYALKHAKTKRIYINCKLSLANYYEEVGFQQIQKIPKEIEESLKGIECVTEASAVQDQIKAETTLWYAYDRSRLRDKSFESKPDLIVIDGGKGQLSAAVEVLKKYNLKTSIISIAKREEEIFIPTVRGAKLTSQQIVLEKTDEMLKLIQRLRDEAHRFAITFNKDLREKRLKS